MYLLRTFVTRSRNIYTSWALLTVCYNFSRRKLFYDVMYVCPCIIYEIDERYSFDATVYLLL